MTAKLLLHPFIVFRQQLHELRIHASSNEKRYFFFYIIASICLFLYSYTQVDLGLVITRVTWLYGVEKQFQYIGYFNRPLSTVLFLCIAITFLFLYLFFLYSVRQKKVKAYTIWSIIGVVTIILAFSYNAFSYDLFNYIFDAKIVTHYHQNPYIHKALDYPQDSMLAFMHWTHREYPYGPVWLALTIPLSFLGLRLFLLTFFLFKFFVAACFLGAVFFIGKIFRKINPQQELFGLVFFGLNPLVIIECLVSAHIDTAMIFFGLMSVYYLLEKRYVASYFFLLMSIGIKFMTVMLFPLFLIVTVLLIKKREIKWNMFYLQSLILLILGVIIEARQSGNFQPWYLVIVLSFTAFLSQKYFVFVPSVIVSFAALLLYIPYLFLGNWNPPVPQILSGIMLTSYALSFGVVGYFIFNKKQKV